MYKRDFKDLCSESLDNQHQKDWVENEDLLDQANVKFDLYLRPRYRELVNRVNSRLGDELDVKIKKTEDKIKPLIWYSECKLQAWWKKN